MLNLGQKLYIATNTPKKIQTDRHRVGRLHAKAALCRSLIKAGSSVRDGVCHRLMSGFLLISYFYAMLRCENRHHFMSAASLYKSEI